MIRVAASLAAALLAIGVAACDEGGAEPGASGEATLVLDFVPNAVHTGIYAAQAEGLYDDAGIDLEIREPSASTDAPKLLEAGRTEFAVMDINDVGLAQERGLDIVPLTPIVQVPLAAVIAGDRNEVRRPADLEGGTVGVTGLPSDDAVLESVLRADGADLDAVDTVTIGFDSIPALSAGRVDAVTAFWNAEGVTLTEMGLSTREFRVRDWGAPRFPELLLVTSKQAREDDPALVRQMAEATRAGYASVVEDPEAALDALADAVEELDRGSQQDQLDALLEADAFKRSIPTAAELGLASWAAWAAENGLIEAG